MKYRFGDFEVDAARFVLTRRGQRVKIEPRPLQLLIHLLERAPDAVSKDELLDALWPEVAVTEASLTRAVGEVRRALRERAGEAGTIRTVRGKGYAIGCEIQRVDASDEALPDGAPRQLLASDGPSARSASFIETVGRAGDLLREQGSISFKALKYELELEDAALEDLVEELVEVQRVAAHEGKVIVWRSAATEGEAPTAAAPVPPEPIPEAERRQLTVLFCDLVDSTRLAASMDPEEWREVVRGYQEVAADVVERFEGYIAQYLGDGILAYFGWPRAHEDEAERSVRAALGIVDALKDRREGLSVRIGIHTGPVVVGEMGVGDRREALAIGETANVAARMQRIAAPGTVALSAATLRLASGIFVTRDLGHRPVKGLNEPVHAFEAVQASGVRSRLDVTAASQLTPFIGREQELGLLEDRFAQAAEGRGQAVLIRGEAGIGKSRLVQAFRERMTEYAHTWLECRGSPYSRDSALHPVVELQRQGLGFEAADPPEGKRAALEAGLAGVGLGPIANAPLLADLHGVPVVGPYATGNAPAEEARRKTLELLAEWVVRISRRQPLVLLMEDLHWMDSSTIQLLGQILEQVPAERVLLLGTHRSDFEPPWGARSFVTPMLLSRFTRAQLADLVRKAARDRDLPARWVEAVLRRSDGMPLFAEELTRTLLESESEFYGQVGESDLRIPETLQDSLMARLDALGPAKRLAQLAAVLGREFSHELLREVAPMTEAELERDLAVATGQELVYRRGRPPNATYLFKHELIRDAAYQSLLRARRREHHARVARVLADRFPESSRGDPERVALHYAEGGCLAEAAAWWRRAGKRAQRLGALSEAEQHYRRSLDALDEEWKGAPPVEDELAVQLELGPVLFATQGYGSREATAALDRALELTQASGHAEERLNLLVGLHGSLLGREEFEGAARIAERVLEVAASEDDPRLLTHGWVARGHCHYELGELRQAREAFERAVAFFEPGAHGGEAISPGPRALMFLARSEWALGRPELARRLCGEALERMGQTGKPYDKASAHVWAGVLGTKLRDPRMVRLHAGAAAQISEREGFRLRGAEARALAGWAQFELGEHENGLRELEGGVRDLMATGIILGRRMYLGLLIESLLRMGALESVGEWFGRVPGASNQGVDHYSSTILRLRGDWLARGGSALDAERHYRESLDVARQQGARFYELRAAMSCARLWSSQGQRIEGRDLLQSACTGFSEGLDTRDLMEARALLEELA